MKSIFYILLIASTSLFASINSFEIIPINHASIVLKSNGKIIFVDPVGQYNLYKEYGAPDLVLITHIHHDHLNIELLDSLRSANTVIIGPSSVTEKITDATTLNNGQNGQFAGIDVEAIPAYNLTTERLKFHPKGRDNGYVLTLNNKRIYISGDTEDIPEMRSLKNIDYAFVCMNLPYTMDVEQAASSILEFQPKVITPYHYRGSDGYSDLEKLKSLLSKNKSIEVKILDFYK